MAGRARSAGFGSPSGRFRLPSPVSSLFGRDRQIGQLRRLLLKRRLVVLTGVGGCGKTRVALEVTARARDRFADGASFVSLASVGDARQVEATVIHALGLRESPGQSLAQALELALRDRELLLVLDNFEHLLEAAPLVAEWLELCPALTILVTSRAPLRLPGEQVFPVPPLTLPGPTVRVDAAEAVRLFIERARGVRSDVCLTEANAAAVAEICRRLDGLPLAIELAAARMRAMSVEQILARLDDRLTLLTGGSPAALPRHRTLRALIDWSHDLLSEQEHTLLRRLSVFAGGWTLDAAEVVCGEDDGPLHKLRAGWATDRHYTSLIRPTLSRSNEPALQLSNGPSTIGSTLDVLAGLVDKSLVLFEERAGHSRYRMLETIREYALERLRKSGEAAAIQERHCDWFLALTVEANRHRASAEQSTWLDRLEAEHDNIRAAMQWCLERADAERGLRFGAVLWWFWYGRGHATEGRAWYDRLLGLDATSVSPRVRGEALFGAGTLAFEQTDYGAAERLAEGCLVAQPEDPGGARLLLGNIARGRGDYVSARVHYDAVLVGFRDVDYRPGFAIGLGALGHVALAEGDHARARELYERALAIEREHGQLLDVANLVYRLGETAYEEGRATLPERAADEAVARPANGAGGGPAPAPSGRSDPSEQLTAREREVAALVTYGHTNRQIARELMVAERTVETHLERIFVRLGLSSRTQLAVWAVERGLPVDPRN